MRGEHRARLLFCLHKKKRIAMLERLRHDVELKKQVVAVSLIASVIIALEALIFFAVVTPQVERGLKSMLRTDETLWSEDTMAQSLLRCVQRRYASVSRCCFHGNRTRTGTETVTKGQQGCVRACIRQGAPLRPPRCCW